MIKAVILKDKITATAIKEKKRVYNVYYIIIDLKDKKLQIKKKIYFSISSKSLTKL